MKPDGFVRQPFYYPSRRRKNILHIDASFISFTRIFCTWVTKALSRKADTFQFFSRNPRQQRVRKSGRRRYTGPEQLMAAHHFAPISPMSAKSNGCSKTEKTRSCPPGPWPTTCAVWNAADNCLCSIPAAMSDRALKRYRPHCRHAQHLYVPQPEDDGPPGNHGRQGDGSGQTFEELAAIIDKADHER